MASRIQVLFGFGSVSRLKLREYALCFFCFRCFGCVVGVEEGDGPIYDIAACVCVITFQLSTHRKQRKKLGRVEAKLRKEELQRTGALLQRQNRTGRIISQKNQEIYCCGYVISFQLSILRTKTSCPWKGEEDEEAFLEQRRASHFQFPLRETNIELQSPVREETRPATTTTTATGKQTERKTKKLREVEAKLGKDLQRTAGALLQRPKRIIKARN